RASCALDPARLCFYDFSQRDSQGALGGGWHRKRGTMIAGLAGFLVAFATVLVLERFIQPQRSTRPVFHRMSMLSAMPMIVFYMSIFMATYRPIFATVFGIIFFL